jgi:hypothetical protein
MKSLARIKKRQGRCWELAMMAMMREPEADRFTLVHGSILLAWQTETDARIRHAWIELSDGRIYDPVKDSYEPAEQYMTKNRALVEHRYSRVEAARVCTEAKHSGPWTDPDPRFSYHSF